MVRETVEGLLSAAGGEDMKIIFFTSFADNHTSQNYDRYQDYDTGDFAVYLLPDLNEYDALISFDTYMTGSFIAPIDRLKKEAPCPVITLGTVKEGTYSIVNDQDLADQGAFGVDKATYDENGELVEHGKITRWELGAQLTAEFKYDIMTNVAFSSKFIAFYDYLHKSSDLNAVGEKYTFPIDIDWDNA